MGAFNSHPGTQQREIAEIDFLLGQCIIPESQLHIFLSLSHTHSLTSLTSAFQNASDGESHVNICPLVSKVDPAPGSQLKNTAGVYFRGDF